MGPPRRSLGGAETFKWVVFLQTLQTVVFKEKTRKNKNHNETDDPGTQNGTVPKGADKRSTHYLRHILTFFFLFFNTERIQCYLQCFVALQDGSVAETFKWVVFKETTRKHKNHEDSEVFWGRQDAVSEGPKPLNGLCSFKLCKKLFLKNKQGKTSIPKTD